MQKDRYYRYFHDNSRWKTSQIKEETSDLMIMSSDNIELNINEYVRTLREKLREHIQQYPEFLSSFQPLQCPDNAPEFITEMYKAAELFNVGPMAAVAGAIAEKTGQYIRKNNKEVIIENGGDIWVSLSQNAKIGIYNAKTMFKDKLAIKINSNNTPLGICTSSGQFGHSTSFGKADIVTVVSPSAIIADTAATALCNKIQSEHLIEPTLNYANSFDQITGVIIIYKDKIGIIGDIELTDF